MRLSVDRFRVSFRGTYSRTRKRYDVRVLNFHVKKILLYTGATSIHRTGAPFPVQPRHWRRTSCRVSRRRRSVASARPFESDGQTQSACNDRRARESFRQVGASRIERERECDIHGKDAKRKRNETVQIVCVVHHYYYYYRARVCLAARVLTPGKIRDRGSLGAGGGGRSETENGNKTAEPPGRRHSVLHVWTRTGYA